MNPSDDLQFTFYFNPEEVKQRFDAILGNHLANIPSTQEDDKGESPHLTLCKAKANLIKIHTQILQLKAQSAKLREAMHTLSDQERQNAYDELTQRSQRVEALLSDVCDDAAYVTGVTRLMRKRSKKRAAVKERREQRQRMR